MKVLHHLSESGNGVLKKTFGQFLALHSGSVIAVNYVESQLLSKLGVL